MEFIVNIYEIIIGNTLYTIVAASLLFLVCYGVIKKLFKLTLIIVICTMIYLVYVYFYKSPEEAADKLDQIGYSLEETMNTFEEAVTNPIIDLKNSESIDTDN